MKASQNTTKLSPDMKRRYFAIPLLLLATALLVFIQIATHRITSPERRKLRDYHYQILAEPAEHGLEISSHIAADGTPYLICQPGPFASTKGRLLRKQLAARGLTDLQPKATALLLLHGHGGRKEDHLPIAERFCAVGFTCILPDLPAHGESPLPEATFGRKEIPLLQELLDGIPAELAVPRQTALFGISQGGAIALQLASHQRERCQAVASLSAFANLGEVMEHSAQRRSALHAGLLPAVTLSLTLQHHLQPSDISPEIAARGITAPTLIVHGAEDQFIPASHAQRIYQQLGSSQKRLRMIPGAGHSDVLVKGVEVYADLAEFFLRASQTSPSPTQKLPTFSTS